MSRTICLIQGHPHAAAPHFCHALADAYAEGAIEAGHALSRFDLGAMDLPLLRDPADFATPAPEPVRAVQAAVVAADHLAIVYPLWLGTMPAVVKAFFEQFARNNFAIEPVEQGWPRQMLKGRSARVIVTMGMPAAAYRIFFGAHGVKSFESGILGMAGIRPIHETLIGGVGGEDAESRAKSLLQIREHGRRGD